MNKYGKIRRCLSVFLLLSMLLSLLPTGVFAQEAVYEPSSTEQVLATKAAGTDYTATLNALERPAAAYSEHEDMSNIPTGSKETVGTGDYVMLVTVNAASYAFAPKNLSTAYSETVDSVRVTIDADGNYLHFGSEEDARSATLTLKANTNNDYKHERLFVRRDGLIVQPIGHNGSPYFRAVTSTTETFGFTYVTGEDGLVAYKGIVLNSGENRTRHNLVFGDGSFFFGNPTTYPREENTTVYFYKMTPITETLYNALQSAKSYAKGNPNGTYDPELYDGFITCLEDAIDLYNASNHYLSKEELARKDELAQALDTRAANLQSFMTLLDQSSYTARAGKLTEALGWQNVHISTIGRTDVLGLDGTYFLVSKASNGKYYVLDPSDSADAKNVGSKEVTLSADGEHVVGTGIEYAVDIIRDPLLEEKHTYYIRLHNGDYLRGEYLNGTACLTMGFSHTPFGLTLRALDSNSAATADGLFFHRNITLNADQTKPNPYPENPKHYLLYHPTEQDFGLINWYNTVSHTMYLYRLTWSTEELYDAIVKMAALADGKKGKCPKACMMALLLP